MTVIIANDTPDAIRGMLKRWFVEPRPNVSVGTLNARTHAKTLDYIKRNAPEFGMLMISTVPNSQGFEIEEYGDTNRKHVNLSGLQLIAETWVDEANVPF